MEAEAYFGAWYDTAVKSGPELRVGVSITMAEPKLMYKIQTMLGFGHARKVHQHKNGRTYFRFEAYSLEDILRLALLCNGNLVLEKRKVKFKAWLKNVEKVRKSSRQAFRAVTFLNRKVLPCLSNAWLSGFLEGDGGFASSKLKFCRLAQGFKIHFDLKFYLSQTHTHAFMVQLKDVFQNPNPIQPKTNPVVHERLETKRLKVLKRVMLYLETYPF